MGHVRETHHNFYHSFHEKRNQKMEEFATDTYRRTYGLTKEYHSRKMLAAQNSIEERIKWRYTHSDVLRQREEYETGKKAFIERSKKRHEEIAQLADNTAQLRKEVCALRELHRLLTKRQAKRKKEYHKSKRQQEALAFKEAVNANAIIKPGENWYAL